MGDPTNVAGRVIYEWIHGRFNKKGDFIEPFQGNLDSHFAREVDAAVQNTRAERKKLGLADDSVDYYKDNATHSVFEMLGDEGGLDSFIEDAGPNGFHEGDAMKLEPAVQRKGQFIVGLDKIIKVDPETGQYFVGSKRPLAKGQSKIKEVDFVKAFEKVGGSKDVWEAIKIAHNEQFKSFKNQLIPDGIVDVNKVVEFLESGEFIKTEVHGVVDKSDTAAVEFSEVDAQLEGIRRQQGTIFHELETTIGNLPAQRILGVVKTNGIETIADARKILRNRYEHALERYNNTGRGDLHDLEIQKNELAHIEEVKYEPQI